MKKNRFINGLMNELEGLYVYIVFVGCVSFLASVYTIFINRDIVSALFLAFFTIIIVGLSLYEKMSK